MPTMPPRPRTVIKRSGITVHKVDRDTDAGGYLLCTWHERPDGWHSIKVDSVHPHLGRLSRGTIRQTGSGWEWQDHDFTTSPQRYADYIDAENALVTATAALDDMDVKCLLCDQRQAVRRGACEWCYGYEMGLTDEKPTTRWDDERQTTDPNTVEQPHTPQALDAPTYDPKECPF